MIDKTPPPLVLTVAASMCCTLVAVVFARLAYGLIMPSMQQSLGLTVSAAANLGTVTAFGYLTLVLPAGTFAARYGARRAVLLGLSLGALGFTGLAFASQYFVLIGLMVLLGAATAFAYTPLISLLSNWFPHKRGTVIGFANAGVGLGMLVAGNVVPFFTSERFAADTGWRLVWGVFALCACLCIVLAYLILRNPPREGEPIPVGETVTKSGIRGVYRNRHVVTVAFIYGIVGVVYIVQSLFMYSFMLSHGIHPITAGRLVAVMGMLGVVAGPSWGWGSDRIGHSNALTICMSASAVGMLIPVFMPNLVGFSVHYLLMGVSITGLFTTILAAATKTVKPMQAPVAVSFVTVLFALGQLLGPALAGLLIEKSHSYTLTFFLCSGLLTVGVYLCWLTAQLERKALSR
jgi:MFS family permease